MEKDEGTREEEDSCTLIFLLAYIWPLSATDVTSLMSSPSLVAYPLLDLADPISSSLPLIISYSCLPPDLSILLIVHHRLILFLTIRRDGAPVVACINLHLSTSRL